MTTRRAITLALAACYALAAARELARHTRAEHRAHHPNTGGTR